MWVLLDYSFYITNSKQNVNLQMPLVIMTF